MQRTFWIPFGQGGFRLELEGELIEPPCGKAVEDERQAIRLALNRPIGAPPLKQIVRPGESVAVIVNDVTRRTRSHVFLPVLVEALNQAGVPDGDIFIVFALGTHRRQTADEQRQVVGEEIAGRLQLYDHDGADEANLVEVGATRFGNEVWINRRVWEADRIILTGQIVEHRITGYSGGPKSLVPGVAGNRTTIFNHRMLLDPRCAAGVLDGNPAYEDLREACSLVNPDFILNVILNTEGRLLHVVAGHFDEAHRRGCQAAAALLRSRLEAPFDVVIASAGGWPLDIDLRQAHKGMENAVRALRPGGVLIYYAECREGAGAPALEEYLRRFRGAAGMEQALRENFVLGAHKALWLARLGERYQVHLVSRFDPDLVRRCGMEPVASERHEQCVRELLARTPQARVAVIPNASVTVPYWEGGCAA